VVKAVQFTASVEYSSPPSHICIRGLTVKASALEKVMYAVETGGVDGV